MEVILIIGVHLIMEDLLIMGVHLIIETMENMTMAIRNLALSQMCPKLNLPLQDLRKAQISLSRTAMVL